MVRPVKSESALPSTLTAYGGSGCVAMAVSSDGITIAAATDDYINIYPVYSIWVPCISLQIPTKICPINMDFQSEACGNPYCLYRDPYEPYLKPTFKVVRKRLGKHRMVPQGTIQILNFFGDKNEFLVGTGPFLLIIYDLTKMDPNPMITIDMRYFGVEAYSYPCVMQASFSVLNIYRNYLYNNRILSCIDFVFSTRPYIPTYFRVFFDEAEKWWFVDCRCTVGILPRESLDENIAYILYNHDGSSAFRRNFNHRHPSKHRNTGVRSRSNMDIDNPTQNNQTQSSTTTDTTCENTENETGEFTQAQKSSLVVDLRNNVGESPCTSPDYSGYENRSIAENDASNIVESAPQLSPGNVNAEVESEGSDTNMNNVDEMDETKSNTSDQIYKDGNFPDLETSNLGAPGPYFYRQPDRSVYYGFCLLERRFICSGQQLSEFAKPLGDSTLTYKQEFLFTTYIPLASVVIIKLTLENKFHVMKGKLRYCELGKTSSSLLSDSVISAVGMKAHSFVSRRLGRLFTILFNDRFYVLKYTTSSLVSTHLEEYHESVKSENARECKNEVKDGSRGPKVDGSKEQNGLKLASHNTKRYRIVGTFDSVQDSISVQFCHYDPVLKVRYTKGCFDTSKGDGYLAICTNYTSQWSLQIFSLSSQSGVDAIRLVLDASKCNGFTQLSWIPFSNKLFVISRLNGELYQLEPKVVRSWVGLIPNFSCIDKNLEFIEAEDTFDLKPAPAVASPKHKEELEHTNSGDSRSKRADIRGSVSYRYPFTDLGFSLIGNAWLKPKFKPKISQYDPVYHCDDPEVHDCYKSLFLSPKFR